MDRTRLFREILSKKSFLCVGLDSDLERIPRHLRSDPDPVFSFNKTIIDSTRNHCVAYKLNIAFYEALGSKGWDTLERTVNYIGPGHFRIADAKRGDIGNTSRQYARAFFQNMDFDAITVAPYMGEDSVSPFWSFKGKWVILLALTSNMGSNDFQLDIQGSSGEPLYEKVVRKAMEWGGPENLMFVVGATHPEKFREIRKIAPDHFLLVPGVGAQGGDLEAVARNGWNDHCGILVNSSRGIIFAGEGPDFDLRAAQAARELQQQMARIIDRLSERN